MKSLKLVYQTCVGCGKNLGWWINQKTAAEKAGYEVVQVSFLAEDAKEAMAVAKDKNITLPFFELDGKVAKTVEEVVKKATSNRKKSSKKAKKVEIVAETVEADDGNNPEAV